MPSINWILPEGSVLEFNGLSRPLKVLRGLGGGGQGHVFEVEVAGEHLALKWYFPNCLARDPYLPERLTESIRATAPNSNFLWPIALLRPTPASTAAIKLSEPGCGYLMGLRPSSFLGAIEHYAGRIEISLQNVLRAGFFLADAFHSLHSKGLCYKDISLGNIFLEPDTGRILICDNDNVDVDGRDLCGVLGTPGFIAPEVLMNRARPSTNTDLFSLAVLLFRLLTRHDPLKGQMDLEIQCLDEPARRHLYGEDPVFIFDPHDQRNQPNPVEHGAALITWPIYPPKLQSLFLQTFCDGMKDPKKRALTGQWKEILAKTIDHRVLCHQCGQENFPDDPGKSTPCWNCKNELTRSQTLRLANGVVTASPENKIYPHHFDNLKPPQLKDVVAQVVQHPSDPCILGLKNLSEHSWSAILTNGTKTTVEAGKTCNLSTLIQLLTPMGDVITTI
tara:strand:+ start:6218 stop:7561 length:1344 start_codon:yes stop_codon:yes gene_type:complete